MWLLLVACGGPTELPKPHPPPEWPIENVYVKGEGEGPPAATAPAPERATPAAPDAATPEEPAPDSKKPEAPTPAPEATP